MPRRKLPYARTRLRKIAKLCQKSRLRSSLHAKARDLNEIEALAVELEQLLHNSFRRPNKPGANATSVRMTDELRQRIVELDRKGYPGLEISFMLRIDRSRVTETLRKVMETTS